MKINFSDLETKFRRAKYRFSSDILTMDNIFITVIILISVAWIWGNIAAMEKNYALQRKLELKQRQALIDEINYQTLQYEQKYLQSSEYQELAARSKLGLAAQGESILILSKYPEEKKTDSNEASNQTNFTKWMNFLFGGNAKRASGK